MAGMVIVGAGECGVSAAFSLRRQGFEGAVTVVGGEASLPYERPPLSKSGTAAPKAIRPENAYAEAGIELRRGVAVEAVHPQRREVRLANGDTLGYDRLLLATGARARSLPGCEDCLTLRSDEDARRIVSAFGPGARIGLVGGGFIGLELAAMARQAGARVSVIESAPRLLARAVPPAIAAIIQARHQAEGVDIRTGTGVARISGTQVVLGDGTRLAFDTVITGIGSVPNCALAEEAGLEVDNGIVVDASFRTRDPHIFAAGDCCNFTWRGRRVRLESWRAAQEQGAHAAGAMLGNAAPYTKVPWFWSDQFDLTLHVAGLFDASRATHTRRSSHAGCVVFQCDDGRLSAAAGIGPGSAAATDIRILEKLIERGSQVEAGALRDADFDIKRLLKSKTAHTVAARVSRTAPV